MSGSAGDTPDGFPSDITGDAGDELDVAVGPDLFAAPGAGDVDPEPTDAATSEIGMFYTHGGTPC